MNLSFNRTATENVDEVSPSSDDKLQYCRILTSENAKLADCRKAWKAMQKSMALVPGGGVLYSSQAHTIEDPDNRHYQLIKVPGFYLDRLAVSNIDFLAFVRAGGYTNMKLWPNQMWPCIVQLVDQTGNAGPGHWKYGKPPREKLDHPVTGVCWYEAMAYAKWVGKTLPGTQQWQRACTWGVSADGRQDSVKFPWGNMYEDRRANLWSSGFRDTVPVDQYVEGCTVNGVHQLIGNVWEWIDNQFTFPGANEMQTDDMAEIRGGAFDTYLSIQANSQFRSGQPRLFRSDNIGFRCGISTGDIKFVPNQ